MMAGDIRMEISNAIITIDRSILSLKCDSATVHMEGAAIITEQLQRIFDISQLSVPVPSVVSANATIKNVRPDKKNKKVSTFPIDETVIKAIRSSKISNKKISVSMGCNENFITYLLRVRAMRPSLIQPLGRALDVPVSIINGIITAG